MKRFLVDPGSSTNVLYRYAFKGMSFDVAELLPFKGSLVSFSGKHVKVLGHLPMMTTFGSGDNAKSVKLRYLVVNVAPLYNIIIRRRSFNDLEMTLSTL